MTSAVTSGAKIASVVASAVGVRCRVAVATVVRVVLRVAVGAKVFSSVADASTVSRASSVADAPTSVASSVSNPATACDDGLNVICVEGESSPIPPEIAYRPSNTTATATAPKPQISLRFLGFSTSGVGGTGSDALSISCDSVTLRRRREAVALDLRAWLSLPSARGSTEAGYNNVPALPVSSRLWCTPIGAGRGCKICSWVGAMPSAFSNARTIDSPLTYRSVGSLASNRKTICAVSSETLGLRLRGDSGVSFKCLMATLIGESSSKGT